VKFPTDHSRCCLGTLPLVLLVLFFNKIVQRSYPLAVKSWVLNNWVKTIVSLNSEADKTIALSCPVKDVSLTVDDHRFLTLLGLPGGDHNVKDDCWARRNQLAVRSKLEGEDITFKQPGDHLT